MRLAKSKVIGISLVRDVASHNAVGDLPSPHSYCPSLLDALQVCIDQKRAKVALRHSVWLLNCPVTMDYPCVFSNSLVLLFGVILPFN